MLWPTPKPLFMPLLGMAAGDAGLEKPFGYCRAVAEAGLPVRRAQLVDGLRVGVKPDATVPIHWRGRGATGDQNHGQKTTQPVGRLSRWSSFSLM